MKAKILYFLIFFFNIYFIRAQSLWEINTPHIYYPDSIGNVGIGTSFPNYKLDLAGILNLNKGIGEGIAMFVNGKEALWSNGDYFSWGFGANSNYFDKKVGIGVKKPEFELEVAGILNLNKGIGEGIAMFVNGKEALWSNGDYFSWGFGANSNYFDKKVGIGVKKPEFELEVAGILNLNKGIGEGIAMFVNGKEALWSNGDYFSWGFGANSNYFDKKVGIGVKKPEFELEVAGILNLNKGIGEGIAMFVNGKEALWSNGDYFSWGFGANSNYFARPIMIGTRNLQDGYLLGVNGKIKCREVRVTNENWADFVFENDYELPSLESVEKFIKDNKHLPDLPSAEEVLENGTNLGEIDAILLQKIEELTLYLIEINKENQKLRAQIEILISK